MIGKSGAGKSTLLHILACIDTCEGGEYKIPSLDELIDRTVGALREFYRAGKPVIRLGLQASDGVLDENNVYSDTYRPAMGEISVISL